MIVVVDTNVVVSAAFWPRSQDRRCFVLLARRKCRLAVTEAILDELKAGGYGLLVMGSPFRRGLEVMRDAPAAILKAARCDLLFVRPQD